MELFGAKHLMLMKVLSDIHIAAVEVFRGVAEDS